MDDVAYWVRREMTGEGLASAAVRVLSAGLSHGVDLDQLEITCDAANVRSCRGAAKAGFRHVPNRPCDIRAAGQSGVESVWRRSLLVAPR